MESGLTAAILCVFLLVFCACAEGLTCAGCGGSVTCPPAPVGCSLAREPCGCCDVCALRMGERCHGYSAGCGPGLMCLTPIGPFPHRPPVDTNVHGRCVLASNPVPPTLAVIVPPTILPLNSLGRK